MATAAKAKVRVTDFAADARMSDPMLFATATSTTGHGRPSGQTVEMLARAIPVEMIEVRMLFLE